MCAAEPGQELCSGSSKMQLAGSSISPQTRKEERAESVAKSYSCLPHSALCSPCRTGCSPTGFHLVYDRFQLKISSRLEEGETSRFCRVPQRRRPPSNEPRCLLSPFILSSVRKKSVKARKYSKITSWLHAGRDSWRRNPQCPPWRLSRRKK